MEACGVAETEMLDGNGAVGNAGKVSESIDIVPEVVPSTPAKKRPLDSAISAEKGLPLSPGTFEKLKLARATLGSNKGNPSGHLHSTSHECSFCSRRKHSCGWGYRWNMKTRVVSGSLCDSCMQACHKLGTGKCIAACKATPLVLDAIVKKSREISTLKTSDVCLCGVCEDKPPPRRLRQKTRIPDVD